MYVCVCINTGWDEKELWMYRNICVYVCVCVCVCVYINIEGDVEALDAYVYACTCVCVSVYVCKYQGGMEEL